MPALSEIRGQDRAIALLRRALAQGRLPHGYLFTGPANSGKLATGRALAAAANCLRFPGEGCSDCESCGKIADGNHPDVRTLSPDGAARIVSIDTVRREVLAQIGLPPHEARARFYLVEEAGALNDPAANALLKTLEEPPGHTHFVLVTTAADRLLPTIRSRCQRVPFAALSPELGAALSGDADAGDFEAMVVDRLLAAISAGDAVDLHDSASAVAEDKAQLAPLLHALAHRLHGSARQAATAGELVRARACARGAALALEAETAVTRHNAHPQLALDALLRRLRATGAELAPRSP
jgi:DNA polymerase-3 subunit delta'